MSLLDILIVVLLFGAILRGFEEGLVHQLCSAAGFFGGLMLGAMLEPHIIGWAHTPATRLGITLGSTIGVALIFLFVGELIGVLIKRKLRVQGFLNRADNIFGSGVAVGAIVALVWLGSAIANSLPYPSLREEVHNSKLVTTLTRRLPTAPNIIADLGRLLAPNGFPDVFVGIEPAPTPTELPTPAALAPAVAKDRASVVKIEGQGCGGIVAGSGFVVGSTFVATNAHVVAGIPSPVVIDTNGSHRATVVWFDPNLDFAVLRTTGLAGAPLPFNADTVTHGTTGGVLGYPGGGNFEAGSAAVLDEFTAQGRNIYGQGQTKRDVYSIQAKVVPGNSGGPLINLNGEVIGVVFATSTTYDSVGYALGLQAVMHEIGQAKATNQPVSTGGCAE